MTAGPRRVGEETRVDLPAGVRPPTFALFAEMLVVGAIVSILSLGIVTLPPALAAGIGHLRRHASLRSDRLGLLLADFRAHLHGVWAYAAALPLAGAVLTVNVLTASTTNAPGLLVRWVSIALGAAIVVVVLRSAARKAAGRRTWAEAVRLGRHDARHDLRGSVLLVVAAGVSVVVVWMLPILILITPGMLTLALVGVEQRLHGTDLSYRAPAPS